MFGVELIFGGIKYFFIIFKDGKSYLKRTRDYIILVIKIGRLCIRCSHSIEKFLQSSIQASILSQFVMASTRFTNKLEADGGSNAEKWMCT